MAGGVSKMNMRSVDIHEKSKCEFSFDTNSNEIFSYTLKKYMEEKKLTIEKLSLRSGLAVNTIINYRGGHFPKNRNMMVMLCIGLMINPQKADHLFELAHISIGKDDLSSVYRILIMLAFISDIDISECNYILEKYGFPKL